MEKISLNQIKSFAKDTCGCGICKQLVAMAEEIEQLTAALKSLQGAGDQLTTIVDSALKHFEERFE